MTIADKGMTVIFQRSYALTKRTFNMKGEMRNLPEMKFHTGVTYFWYTIYMEFRPATKIFYFEAK